MRRQKSKKEKGWRRMEKTNTDYKWLQNVSSIKYSVQDTKEATVNQEETRLTKDGGKTTRTKNDYKT